jgi:hypothetical protein
MEVEPALTKVKLSGGIFTYYCSMDAGLESKAAEGNKTSKIEGFLFLFFFAWMQVWKND